jgi:DNA-binding transcriptional MerR regulator
VAEHRAVPRAMAQPKAGRSVQGIRVGSVPSGQSSLLDDGFRGPQVCQLVGISYRQLDYWARTGLLRPSLAEAKGSGTKRRYSYRDLLELKVIKRLLDAGVSLQSARRAVGCLREDLGADLAAANLVLSDTTSVLAHSDGELVDLLAGGQGVFNVVPLSGVVNELAADIVRIERPTSGQVVDGSRPARAAGE